MDIEKPGERDSLWVIGFSPLLLTSRSGYPRANLRYDTKSVFVIGENWGVLEGGGLGALETHAMHAKPCLRQLGLL